MKPLPPVSTSDFRLSIKDPVYGTVAMSSADRPWCQLVRARNHPKLGGKINDEFVRDMGQANVNGLVTKVLPDRAFDWDLTQRIARQNVLSEDVDGLALDPYQLDTLNRVPEGGAVLALGCGLGKTITALATALHLTRPTSVNMKLRLFIVCPLNAFATWKPFMSWMEQRFDEVEIISQDSLHLWKGLAPNDNSCIIFDEAHGMGVWSAQRTRLAHYLRWQFKSCLCLTGTLLHAGPEKVLSLLDLAIPGAAVFGNKYEFGRHFGCLVKKNIGAHTVHTVDRVPSHRLAEFQKYLDRVVICKNKRSPDVMASVVIPDQDVEMVEIGDTSQSLTAEAVATARELMAETPGELPAMMKVMHRMARVGTAEKVDWLLEQMIDNDEPVVVFATYHDTLDAVEARFIQDGIKFARVDGSVTGAMREQIIQEFQAGVFRVFLAQTDAASVSMNLQRATISVMMDTPGKAVNYEQALARTCRRGQQHRCHHFNAIGNHYQKFRFKLAEAARDFDAQTAEYQDMKQGIQSCSSQP